LEETHTKLKVIFTLFNRKVIKKNLNPIWNEKFEIKSFDMNDKIEIEVYDYDCLTSNDYMGKIIINPIFIKSNSKNSKWYNLVGMNKTLKSQILIEGKFNPNK
jgi:Ca2+-dependent lipid-binding protein